MTRSLWGESLAEAIGTFALTQSGFLPLDFAADALETTGITRSASTCICWLLRLASGRVLA